MSLNFRIIINNRDRLITTKKLVEDLLERDTNRITIIDNGSTYPPLLEWYNKIASSIDIRKNENEGYLALFSTGLINEIKEEWCFYTDSDIQLNVKMPKNYQEIMLEYAIKLDSKKIGLALDISDIPDYYALKEQVLRNEGGWWLNQVEPNVYKADTDTTFSLIKKVDQYQSYRISGDFTSKHIPWYFDLNNLPEDEKYYLDHYDNKKLTQYTKQHKKLKEIT